MDTAVHPLWQNIVYFLNFTQRILFDGGWSGFKYSSEIEGSAGYSITAIHLFNILLDEVGVLTKSSTPPKPGPVQVAVRVVGVVDYPRPPSDCVSVLRTLIQLFIYPADLKKPLQIKMMAVFSPTAIVKFTVAILQQSLPVSSLGQGGGPTPFTWPWPSGHGRKRG